jgi:hypothetical protein
MVFVFEQLLVLFLFLARVLALSVGIRGFLVGDAQNKSNLRSMGI